MTQLTHGIDHEYTLLNGTNRSGIGRWIALIAAAIASAAIFVFLAFIDVARSLGWAPNIPPIIMWPVSAGVIYVALYWLFDRYLWRFVKVRALLKLPDLQGAWVCQAKTLNADKSTAHEWGGELKITQSWDRLKIRLETKHSVSTSIAAAIAYDEADGFLVIYHYRNEPKADAPADMRAHRGFGELKFASDCQSATGEYFNGLGRFTFGTMTLERS